MKIHNKNLRESGEWEDYTDGADIYSPEFEQQQELTELERERFDSLSLAGQIAEATGTDAEEIQIVLDEAAENDYPNQVVLESLQEILGISEDEMIRTVLPILKNHGFEGDYTADHYDIDDDEEDIIFESVRKNSKKRVKENTNGVKELLIGIIKDLENLDGGEDFLGMYGHIFNGCNASPKELKDLADALSDYGYDDQAKKILDYKSEKMTESYNYVSDDYENYIYHFCDVHENLEVNYYREIDLYQIGDPEEEKYININLWYSEPEGEGYTIATKDDSFEGQDFETFKKDLEKAYNNVVYKNKKMSESYSANRGSLRKSYAELHPEVKENMREGVNSISFSKKDRNNVEATFDTDDGVHVENYDTHRAVGIARDWVRKGYVCKVNGEPVDDPTVFDDCSDEGEMTCTASWRKQESSKVTFLKKKLNEAKSREAKKYYSERLKEETSREGNKRLNERFSSAEEERDAVEKFCILMDWEIKPEDVLHCVKNSDNTFTLQTENGDQFTYDPVKDCLRESQKRSVLATKNRRIAEAYSANRGSATKSYAEMHPEMKENSKTTFLANKLREAKSPRAKEYYLARLKEERVREASYQKFELPKKATPGDKDYNPDEPGKKPAKRDWTSGKMKSVNGIYGRRAWTTKEPKSK